MSDRAAKEAQLAELEALVAERSRRGVGAGLLGKSAFEGREPVNRGKYAPPRSDQQSSEELGIANQPTSDEQFDRDRSTVNTPFAFHRADDFAYDEAGNRLDRKTKRPHGSNEAIADNAEAVGDAVSFAIPVVKPGLLAMATQAAASSRIGAEARERAGGDKATGEDTVAGGIAGGALGLLGKAAAAGAKGIRNSRSVIGEDIRTVEKAGKEPQLLPTRPVSRIYEDVPSDLPINKSGRGQMAHRSAKGMEKAIDKRDTNLGKRLNDELGSAREAQGDRLGSVESAIALVDEKLARIDIPQPTRTKLEQARKVLTGELEPSQDIFLAETARSPQASPLPTRDFDVPLTRPDRLTDADIDVGSTRMRDEVAGPAEMRDAPAQVRSSKITVPTGDVRGPEAEGLRHVRSAEQINQLRDLLDSAARMDKIQHGLPEDTSALAELANHLRHKVMPQVAPKYTLANKRFNAATRKSERTRERMRTENDETLAQRIAMQGSDLESAGIKKDSVQALRENFPTDTDFDVNQALDLPRLMLAAERMKLTSPSVQGIAEPVISRLLYPSLNNLPNGRYNAIGGSLGVAAKNQRKEKKK